MMEDWQRWGKNESNCRARDDSVGDNLVEFTENTEG